MKMLRDMALFTYYKRRTHYINFANTSTCTVGYVSFFGQLVILFAYVYHGVASVRNMKRGNDFISKPRINWPVEESPVEYFGFSANPLPDTAYQRIYGS